MAQQSKSEILIIPLYYLLEKTVYKTGTVNRAVFRFSNLRVLIVIDCLFLFLSSVPKPQIPGVLKHP